MPWLSFLATETPIRFEQVSGLACLLRGFGVLRSSLNEAYQGPRRLCRLLDAKIFGLSHGKSWLPSSRIRLGRSSHFLRTGSGSASAMSTMNPLSRA